MSKLALSVALMATALSVSGCASITGSKNQPVSVNSYSKDGDIVEEAKCNLMNDKGSWYVTTPGSVMIQKSYEDLVVACKKKGYPAGTVNVVSSANGGVWGNILAGGIIGYAVDSSSGAGFNYPTNINVEMGKTTTIAPVQPKQTPSSGQKQYN